MTAIEFVQKKINPRITAEYDISLTGQQLFDLLDEYATIAKEMQTETTVYEFLYNSDCCESAAGTISIHKTKKGAEIAMELHRNEKLKEWEKECKKYPYDFDQWWGVRECELLP